MACNTTAPCAGGLGDVVSVLFCCVGVSFPPNKSLIALKAFCRAEESSCLFADGEVSPVFVCADCDFGVVDVSDVGSLANPVSCGVSPVFVSWDCYGDCDVELCSAKKAPPPVRMMPMAMMSPMTENPRLSILL